jgi:hypothetical protein
MKPDLISHLKLVWHPVLIMELHILSIGFLQNVMDLLVDELNPFNEFGGFFDLALYMGRLCMCGHKGQYDINGTQWLKSQPHLKGDVSGQAMERFVVVVFNIGETLIRCAWILGVVHAKDMNDHTIDNLCLSISLGV